MDELKRDLSEMRGRIGDLEASQRMSLREIEAMKGDIGTMQASLTSLTTAVSSLQANAQLLGASVSQSHKASAEMLGTFSSIERHLVKAFEDQAEIERWRKSMEARMEALEKGRPPAA